MIILTMFNISITLKSQAENQYQNLVLISDSLNTATINLSMILNHKQCGYVPSHATIKAFE